MAILVSRPPLILDPFDNPEHYELLDGRWEEKESVGRKDHSAMGRVVYQLLCPVAKQLGCQIEQEWTVVQEDKKLVPDVTLCYPEPLCRVADGYAVAPVLLAVESLSHGQRLQKLVDKCTLGHHAMGTPYCWIIDIGGSVAYECHLGQMEARAVSVLAAGPSISLAVSHLFAEFRGQA